MLSSKLSVLFEKKLFSLILLFSGVAFLLAYCVFPNFLFSLDTGLCDAWFYYALTYAWPITQNSEIFYYFKERLPATLGRAAYDALFPFPWSRYLYGFTLYCAGTFAIARIFKKHLNIQSLVALVVLYLFSSLHYGSLQTDYIAIDSFVFILFSLALLFNRSIIKEKTNLYLSLGAGLFFALGFFSNFKILLYFPLLPFLVLMSPQELKIRKYWLLESLSMFAGFFLATISIASFYYFILGDSFYFFDRQLEAIFLSEDAFERPFLQKVARSPSYILYTLSFLLFSILPRQLRFHPLVLLAISQLVVVSSFALVGGNYFVNSNYIWTLFPFLSLCGFYLSSTQATWKSLIPLILVLPLTFVRNLDLVELMFSYFGREYFLYLFFVLGSVLLIIKKTEAAQNGMRFVAPLFFTLFFLLRPDDYGQSLYWRHTDRQESLKFHKDLQLTINKISSSVTSFPAVLSDMSDFERMNDAIQSVFLMCGKNREGGFGDFKGFEFIVFLSKNKQPRLPLEKVNSKLFYTEHLESKPWPEGEGYIHFFKKKALK